MFSHKDARKMNGLGGFLHSSDCDTDNINIGDKRSRVSILVKETIDARI